MFGAMFGGLEIRTVEPGTVIEQGGETREVTETQAVVKGDIFYVTPKHAAAIRAHPDVAVR